MRQGSRVCPSPRDPMPVQKLSQIEVASPLAQIHGHNMVFAPLFTSCGTISLMYRTNRKTRPYTPRRDIIRNREASNRCINKVISLQLVRSEGI